MIFNEDEEELSDEETDFGEEMDLEEEDIDYEGMEEEVE